MMLRLDVELRQGVRRIGWCAMGARKARTAHANKKRRGSTCTCAASTAGCLCLCLCFRGASFMCNIKSPFVAGFFFFFLQTNFLLVFNFFGFDAVGWVLVMKVKLENEK